MEASSGPDIDVTLDADVTARKFFRWRRQPNPQVKARDRDVTDLSVTVTDEEILQIKWAGLVWLTDQVSVSSCPVQG